MGKVVNCEECHKVYRDLEALEDLRENDGICLVCNNPIEVDDWDRVIASFEDDEFDDVAEDIDEDDFSEDLDEGADEFTDFDDGMDDGLGGDAKAGAGLDDDDLEEEDDLDDGESSGPV